MQTALGRNVQSISSRDSRLRSAAPGLAQRSARPSPRQRVVSASLTRRPEDDVAGKLLMNSMDDEVANAPPGGCHINDARRRLSLYLVRLWGSKPHEWIEGPRIVDVAYV